MFGLISIMIRQFFRWTLAFGATGLIVPAEVLARWAATGSSITPIEWCLWPSAIWLMATEGPDHRAGYILEILALALGANVLVYALIGALTWPFRYLAIRRNR
jgi:hypothetical protein